MKRATRPEVDERQPKPIVPRWLTLSASAMLAAVFGLRLIARAVHRPRSPDSAPATPPATPVKQRSDRRTNGSVPSETADPPAASQRPTSKAKSSTELDLDAVIDRLDRHRQRATYGAVGGVVGKLPIHVMRGRDKTPRHSWVVSQRTGEPTSYPASALHAELTTREHVIDDVDEMRAWLAEHP